MATNDGKNKAGGARMVDVDEVRIEPRVERVPEQKGAEAPPKEKRP